MEEIIYYISNDGHAFESERLCKAYDTVLSEYKTKYKGKENPPTFTEYLAKTKKKKFLNIASTLWGNVPPIKSSIKRINFYRSGFVSAGVYVTKDFVNPIDAEEYEALSRETEENWKEYLRNVAPEDLFYEYDESLLPELTKYGWTMWEQEKPMRGMELALFERHGKACNISYDIYDGQEFKRTYHLDVIGWKYRKSSDPDNDAWPKFQEEHNLKKNSFILLRKAD